MARRGEAPGRRHLAALAALGLASAASAAQPAGTVTVLVGGAPGSGADIWARGFLPFLERHWPHAALAIANRPGEGGLAAARSLAGAAPDGRVIGAVGVPLLLARAVEARAEPLLGRLAFLAAVAEEPLVLVGLAGTVDDLDALRALGPEAVLGTPPHGSAPQLAAAALSRHLPLAPLAVAHAAAARQAVLAGNIACALLALPDAVAALRDGRLAGLGIARDERLGLLPEVPGLAEQGIPVRAAAQRGFAVPRGTDAAVVQPLLAALQAAVEDPEFSAQASADGYLPRYLPGAAWEPMLRHCLGTLSERWATAPWTPRRD